MRGVQKNQKDVTVIQNICSKSEFWDGMYHKKPKGGDMRKDGREKYHNPVIRSKTIEIRSYGQYEPMPVSGAGAICWSIATHENRQPCMHRQLERNMPNTTARWHVILKTIQEVI